MLFFVVPSQEVEEVKLESVNTKKLKEKVCLSEFFTEGCQVSWAQEGKLKPCG